MTLIEQDQSLVWHPFTHQLGARAPVNIVRGEGVYFYDDQGNKFIDAIASWWVNLHGHCHPYISKKVSEQLFQLEHSMFSDFTHAPAVNLAKRLIDHLPSNQARIFYSDNGSTAVEVGLKMTLQYWHNQGIKKTKFIAFENSYHGDTFGSMSVGARNVFNNAFESQLFDVVHLPLPSKEGQEEIILQLTALLRTETIAGFIFEPLVQGAAGMLMYEAALLDELIALCREYKVITIADEVMTGFGRTGRFFASDHLVHKADIMCLSKGLTGGYMPLGVTSCSNLIYDAFLSGDKTKTFFHGHSYTANPTACSAALASLDLLEREETQEQIRMIAHQHLTFMEKIKSHPALKVVRTCGTILAFEWNTKERTHYLNEASQHIAAFFLKRKILLRPLGNIFYLIPPYVITKEELHSIYRVVEIFLDEPEKMHA